MQLDLQTCEFCLADDRPMRLRRARGLVVCCTAGRVWLTIDGEAGDIILTAGQKHRIGANGLALLEAIGGGRVRLQAPSPVVGGRPAWLAALRLRLPTLPAPAKTLAG